MDQPSLALVVLKTRILDRVKAFYECLGMRFRAERHGNGPAHFSAEIGPTVLEIYPAPESDSNGDCATRLGFRVQEPTSVMGCLVAGGAQVVTPTTKTPWGFRTVVRDPDGRAVELYWS